MLTGRVKVVHLPNRLLLQACQKAGSKLFCRFPPPVWNIWKKTAALYCWQLPCECSISWQWFTFGNELDCIKFVPHLLGGREGGITWSVVASSILPRGRWFCQNMHRMINRYALTNLWITILQHLLFMWHYAFCSHSLKYRPISISLKIADHLILCIYAFPIARNIEILDVWDSALD